MVTQLGIWCWHLDGNRKVLVLVCVVGDGGVMRSKRRVIEVLAGLQQHEYEEEELTIKFCR